MAAGCARRLGLSQASRTRVPGGSKRLVIYQQRFNKIVGVVCGCNSREGRVSTCGNDEIEADGDSTKWADVGVCAITSSSEVGGTESGDGAGGRLRCATGSRWKTR